MSHFVSTRIRENLRGCVHVRVCLCMSYLFVCACVRAENIYVNFCAYIQIGERQRESRIS